ncbi:tbc1 domain family member gtpase-activating protein [Holotrichia oblita]|uniref:Tbc1 domain family member gtpase-activating protein n=1 Tax=Holotrichia oblita TaxID=644536 RepID=A0ACB9TWD9_HOLOL|nr:tbc1 domain family member gtpase-activating protein [Holotrichia oblita]
MKFLCFLVVLVASALCVSCADKKWDDNEDHSQHCHIDGYPTIHLNFGESIELPGACLKLLCKQFDLFEAINTCESEPNSKPNVEFATALVKGQKCPK